MKSGYLLGILLLLLTGGTVNAASDFVPVYGDGVNEGFNSNLAPDPVSAADGNPGTTLGVQRRWAFERALEYWERRLDSNIPIKVAVQMNPLTCDAGGAILGAAGASSIHGNWTPAGGGNSAPFPNTWYGQALANRISNQDNSDGTTPNGGGGFIPDEDIGATFNSSIDNNDGCLNQTNWYYATGTPPPGTVSFFNTALHEIGHGINVQTFVNTATGAKAGGADDVYMQFLEDHDTAPNAWPSLSDGQRASSAIDTNNLHWTGPQVLAALGQLTSGTSGGHVEMNAPNPLQGGSSVSHWDTDVNSGGSRELMEPAATGAEKMLVTDEMLHDMGWNDVQANNCTFSQRTLEVTGQNVSGTTAHDGCAIVRYTNSVISSGSTTARSGFLVILQNGFNVKSGATFKANMDPNIGL